MKKFITGVTTGLPPKQNEQEENDEQDFDDTEEDENHLNVIEHQRSWEQFVFTFILYLVICLGLSHGFTFIINGNRITLSSSIYSSIQQIIETLTFKNGDVEL